MQARAMVIVAGGSSERFGGDKLMVEVGGRALIAHTVAAVAPFVDECTLVVREDQIAPIRSLDLGVEVVAGGETRTKSEIAGLAAIASAALIGIHDGARPIPDAAMVERLFATAAEFGGAVPGIRTGRKLIRRDDLSPIHGTVSVQTPQVFWGPELRAAYLAAAREHFDGHDTADIVRRFTNLDITLVEGDPNNIKVTYRSDLEAVRQRLS